MTSKLPCSRLQECLLSAANRNAVQVKNIGQVQVGHVPRVLVAKLAPLLDEKAVTIEGVINDGNRMSHTFCTLSG